MKKISLHSVPRSGSTWLGSILDSSPNVAYRFQPLFSFGHKSQLHPESNLKEIEHFFNDIYKTKDEFVLQKDSYKKDLIPKFEKDEVTHICYKEVRYNHIIQNLLEQSRELKVIGIVRSPFSVVNSWLKAPKEFKKELGWKIEEEWKSAPKKNNHKPEEFNGYNKWKEVCFIFLKLKEKYPKQFCLVNYDDLIKSTKSEVKRIFEFCRLDFTEQTESFIKQSTAISNKDAYSVFKQKKDDLAWKSQLPGFIEEEIKNDPEFLQLNKTFQWTL